ncbi:MAG: hypothetical protein PHP73_03880 [Candidatus Omnitrophica bacterium]|nr:hypothetical protein [Candidatus Omnitrophota bacterium]
MKKRPYICILLVFFLTAVINFGFIALAQENIADEMISRPQIKYKSGQLRDPFASVMLKAANKESLQEREAAESNRPKINLSSLDVQGIIWGTKVPQAIINNKVLVAGDSINGAEILSIDKKGVTLSFAGEIVNLPAPGQTPVLKEKE